MSILRFTPLPPPPNRIPFYSKGKTLKFDTKFLAQTSWFISQSSIWKRLMKLIIKETHLLPLKLLELVPELLTPILVQGIFPEKSAKNCQEISSHEREIKSFLFHSIARKLPNLAWKLKPRHGYAQTLLLTNHLITINAWKNTFARSYWSMTLIFKMMASTRSLRTTLRIKPRPYTLPGKLNFRFFFCQI